MRKINREKGMGYRDVFCHKPSYSRDNTPSVVRTKQVVGRIKLKLVKEIRWPK